MQVLINQHIFLFSTNRHDVWAHLPADLFFKQYEDHPFAPNVIVGAEKNCHPGRPSAPYCSELPESPLPRDIYGRWTDKISKARHKEDYKPSRGPSKKHLDYDKLGSIRPRYINSGSE